MKRARDSDSESDQESDHEEEPRIQDVLDHISTRVSHQDARDLLHSMAASKDILLWSPTREILLHNRRIPRSDVIDLLEYLLLPYNKSFLVPGALTSFLDGLAELKVNKRLIKNKKALSDLIAKENFLKDTETDDEDESDSEDSNSEPSSDEESDSEGSHNSEAEHDGGENSESENNGEDYNDKSGDESQQNEIEQKVNKPCKHCHAHEVYVSWEAWLAKRASALVSHRCGPGSIPGSDRGNFLFVRVVIETGSLRGLNLVVLLCFLSLWMRQ